MTNQFAFPSNEAVAGSRIGQPPSSPSVPDQTRQSMQKLSYTVSEAVAALSIGKTTLYKLISEGRLRVVKMGARTLIPASELQALIAPTVG